MQPVIIVIHLLVVIALVGVVLIQRSEGGGLGIGGGSGFMTARGTRNALTRLTAILAGCFFLTSIILTVLQSSSSSTSAPDLLDRINELGSEFGGALGGSINDDNLLPDASSPQAPSSSAPVLTVPDLTPIPDDNASVAPISAPSDSSASPLPDR